jgi:hypothetical protein
MRPSIIVTGSALAGREYEPPLRDADAVPGACEAIGRELARAGCDLVVFSSSDDYVEKDVVRGYLEALESARSGTVVVRTPYDREVDFGVPDRLKQFIEIRPDAATEWEISYYRALFDADGLFVVGGGRATRIAGTLAVARQTPLIALAMFGAGAEKVWQHFDRHRNDAADDDMHAMGGPWTDQSAARLVDSLLRQLGRRREAVREHEREAARARRMWALDSLLAAGTITAAAFTVWLGFWTQSMLGALGCLLAGPLLAATGGALLRDASADRHSPLWSAARGLASGVLAVSLYVGSQQLSNAEQLTVDSARRLAWFLIPLGLAAGYTVDYVLAKLSRVDVLSGRPFGQDHPSGEPADRRQSGRTED